MKRKFIASLLCLCMIVSLLPVAAFASGDEAVIRAPLGDTANKYTSDQLNINGYTATATPNTTITNNESDVKIYDVTVTHPALLKHSNAQSPTVQGLWVGIGAKITTKGTDNGQSGDGSSYFAFVSADTDFAKISELFKGKDWASQGNPGYSEYGWRQNDGTHVFQWYNLANTAYQGKTPYLVERNPKVEEGKTTYTYNVYRINFNVTEGHLVTITPPANGTLTVMSGDKTVTTGTPVAKGSVLTITPTANPGYEVSAVKVGGTAINAVNGTYTTTVTDADVTISAEFAEKTTLSAVPSTATGLLGKNATDLQNDIAAAVPDADGNVAITGTSKYVTGYTGFSSNEAEQEGNYIALVLKAMKGLDKVAGQFVWVKSSKTPATWTKVDTTDDTMIIRLNGYKTNNKPIEITIANTAPAATATGQYTLDISELVLNGKTPTVNTVTMQGIGFEADRTKAYAAIAALGSDAPQSNITNDTMYARFLGLDKTKEYKVEFLNSKNEVVYSSLKNANADNHVISNTTTSTVYFTFTGEGSVSDPKGLVTDTYTAKLYEKDGSNWKDVTVANSKPVSISKVTFDVNGGSGDIPPVTYYEVGKEVIMPAAPTKDGYIFKGWKVGNATADLAAGAKYTTTASDATIKADFVSDKIASAIVKEKVSVDWVDSTLVATIGTPATTPTNGKYPVDITISGTVTAMNTNDTVTYQLSYTTDKVSTPTTKEVTITKTANGLTASALNLIVGDYTYGIKLDLTELDAKIIPPAAADATVDVKATESTEKNVTGANIAQLTTTITSSAGGTITAADDSVNRALNDATKALNANNAAAAQTELNKLNAAYTALGANPQSQNYDAKENYTTVQAVSYLDIQVTDYDLTTKSESITLEITPKIKYQLVPTTDGKKPIDIGSPINNTLTVTEPVTITFKVPTDFSATVSENDKLFVTHKDTYVYTATANASGVFSFTNPNGFSEFIITKENPAVAEIGGIKYKTLQDAVDAVADNGTITISSNTPGTATVGKAITIKFTNGIGYTADLTKLLTATGNFKLDEGYPKTEGSITTYKFVKTGGTDNGGGGGGVSSNVTIDRPTNGKVTVTPTAPSKGATVTINLTPDTGYTVGTVTVTDKDGKAVELTKVNDTQYTFTMPDGKVTVKATFTKVDTPATGFTDVPADAYYADAVKWAVDKGITNGLTATTFGPNNSCTRGQMVTFLWRAAGSPAATGTNSFSDVASGEYYYNAVLWAVEKGITNGTSATTFSPNATVNRGQTVTFLYRYAESPDATGDTSFTDVTADAFYADAVKWAVAEGITNGTSDTTFAPASNCTRGQIVTFMYRQMAE